MVANKILLFLVTTTTLIELQEGGEPVEEEHRLAKCAYKGE